MGKLLDYANKSSVMEYNISIKGEQFVFNLFDELQINEDIINQEINDQPSIYGFLSTLLKKLIKEMELAEKDMEREFSIVYNRYKEKVNQHTGRIYDKEYAHHIANANPSYNRKKTSYIKAKHDVGVVTSAVKAFEQRHSLIQTLSANKRKEI